MNTKHKEFTKNIDSNNKKIETLAKSVVNNDVGVKQNRVNINNLFEKVEGITIPDLKKELIDDMNALIGKSYVKEFIDARFNLKDKFNQQNGRVTMLKSQGLKNYQFYPAVNNAFPTISDGGMKFTDHKISINNVDLNQGDVSFFVVYKIDEWSKLKTDFDNAILGTCISKTVDNHGRGLMFISRNRGKGLENNIAILGVDTENSLYNFSHVGYDYDYQYNGTVISRIANYKPGAIAGKPGIINVVSVHYQGTHYSIQCYIVME